MYLPIISNNERYGNKLGLQHSFRSLFFKLTQKFSAKHFWLISIICDFTSPHFYVYLPLTFLSPF